MLNNTPSLVTAVNAQTITTAIAARLDFKSGTEFVWTGVGSIAAPANTGDTMLDGQTFHALSPEMVELGENTFSLSGSGELTIALNIPADPNVTLAAAQVYPNEYQARPAILWRAVKLVTNDPLAPPQWYFRRIRSGSMDRLEIQNDGMSHKFILTIESHSGRITNASNQTYLNQRSYDPNDASQDFALSIANGDPAPTRASSSGVYGGGAFFGAGYYGGGGGGYMNNVQLY